MMAASYVEREEPKLSQIKHTLLPGHKSLKTVYKMAFIHFLRDDCGITCGLRMINRARRIKINTIKYKI